MFIGNYFPQNLNQNLLTQLKQNGQLEVSSVNNLSAKSFILSEIFRNLEKKKNLFWVVGEKAELYDLIKSLPLFFREKIINLTKTDFTSEVQRAEFIYNFYGQKNCVFVGTITNFSLVLPPNPFRQGPKIILKKGEKINKTRLFQDLSEMGYQLNKDVDLQKGEYHANGEIVNVFPINGEKMWKIVISFEQVESISKESIICLSPIFPNLSPAPNPLRNRC